MLSWKFFPLTHMGSVVWMQFVRSGIWMSFIQDRKKSINCCWTVAPNRKERSRNLDPRK